VPIQRDLVVILKNYHGGQEIGGHKLIVPVELTGNAIRVGKALYRLPDYAGARQKDLLKSLGMSAATMCRAVRNLVETGHAIGWPATRKRYVKLTEEGRKLFSELFEEKEEKIMKDFNRDYGLPNGRPTSIPVAKPCTVKPVLVNGCPNCGCKQIMEVSLELDQESLKGGKGRGTYLGCPACPYASPMMMIAAGVEDPGVYSDG